MPQDGGDLIKAAETLYGEPLTPSASKEIRKLLEVGIGRAAGLLANIILCDYLNRWNDADGRNLTDAGEAVQLALKLAGDVPIAHYAQGFLHRANGEHQRAFESFSKSLNANPRSLRTRAQLAAEHLYLGRFAEALSEIDRTIAEGANSPAIGMFHWIKGRTLFFMGRYEEAIESLQASISTWPDLWYTQLYLVSAQAHLGKFAEVRPMLASFKERFPNYATITDVVAAEQTNPNDNPEVVKGRAAFHAGLERAGMSRPKESRDGGTRAGSRKPTRAAGTPPR